MKKYDAIVIGASLGGMAAAAYLAAAGKRVLVLEQAMAPPEITGPIFALDPVLVSELRLTERGLRFANRDLALALAGSDGAPVLLGRDRHATAKALAGLSEADAVGWAAFRRQLDDLARRLRPWWWSALETGAPGDILQGAKAKADFARLSLTGADAFLAAHFQSDALVAALLFDASAGGFHVSEPGSALALVWRAAQEMAGLQGAAAMPLPGTLTWSLIKAAGGADFRCVATVEALVLREGAVAGVRLAGGERLAADLVLSSLSRAATEALGGPQCTPLRREVSQMRLVLSLREGIAFPAARLILAERSGLYADAHEAARAGWLAEEVPMELVALAPDKIAVTARPVPGRLSGEDRVHLAARAVQALSRQVPGAARLVAGVEFSRAQGRATLAHLLAPATLRVQAKMPGLYYCGADSEPLASWSGRAARIAAHLILDQK